MKRFLIIIALLLIYTGCGPSVVLHPIEKSDIYRIKAGQCEAEKDGWFISDLYLKEVIKAKVE